MTVILTGASSGIGAAAAVRLAKAGFLVLIAGRDEQRTRRVWDNMRRASPSRVAHPEPWIGDLAEMAQVRGLADNARRLHGPITALVNNAGVECAHRRMTADGFEYCFAVNHLAPMLLTFLLLDRLEGDGARIITTASSNHATGAIDLDDLAHERQWSTSASYDRSKLANVLFTLALRRRTRLPVACFHPGSITTRLNRESATYWREKFLEFFTFDRPAKGTETLVHLVAGPIWSQDAIYFENCRPATIGGQGDDLVLAEMLFERCENLLGLDHFRPLE